jgi:hypothetical protein
LVEGISVEKSLYKGNAKGHPIKNILGVAKEAILPRFQRISHLKEKFLDRIKWRNNFGRGGGPVV